MSVLSITTLRQNIAAYKLLIQSGSITPDFEGKMLEDITDTLNSLILASSTIAGFIDYNSAAPTPSVSSKYQFKSAGAAPSYISGQTTNVKVGDGLFVVKNGTAYTYVWEDKGVNSVELQALRTELLGITDALNLAKQSKSDATLQTNDKTVSGAINETYNRVTTTQYGTGNLVLNPWIGVSTSNHLVSEKSVTLQAGVKYKLSAIGRIGQSNINRYLAITLVGQNISFGQVGVDIKSKKYEHGSFEFTPTQSGEYSVSAFCYPPDGNATDTAEVQYVSVEILDGKEPLPYQTTDEYGDLLTIANNVNIEEGEKNYWHGQLVSRYSYDETTKLKDGIYQFAFQSAGMMVRKIVLAPAGETQTYPDFKPLALSSVVEDISLSVLNLQMAVPSEWYVDANAAIASGKTSGANMPTWSTFTANTNAYTFAINDYIDLQTVEIPHGYKEGSNIQMHLHLATNGTNTTARKVKYQVFFTYVQPDSGTKQFVAEQNFVAELTIPANTPDKSAFVLQMGIISDVNMKFGNQVKMRIKRIAGTGTEPTGNPFLGQVGLHCLCNAVGTTIMQP